MKTYKDSTYLILGMGNIGKMLAKRLLDVGTLAEQIMIYDTDDNRSVAAVDQFGLTPVNLSAVEIRLADIIILAIPPKGVVEALRLIADHLCPEQIIISMAAAVPITRMRAVIKQNVSLVRILPNPPLMLGKGMNPVAFEPGTISEVKTILFGLLEILGQTLEVQDEMMTWCVGLSGAALRTVLPVLEGMTLAGEEAGLTHNEARRVAAQNLSGIAALAVETDLTLDQIRSLTPMQTLDEKMVSNLFLETARVTRQKVESTQAMLMEN